MTHTPEPALKTAAIPNVLRIATAGTRALPPAQAALQSRLTDLFADISEALITPAASAPRLVLLSGLADGADQLVAQTFLAARANGAATLPPRQHVAVLPFDEATYRNRSPIKDTARFDALLAQSALVIELDGRYLGNDDAAGATFARHCRSRAYRSQARVMLQRADLLLAVLELDQAGRPGGTAETVRSALAMDMPVLLFAVTSDAVGPAVYLLRTLPQFEDLTSWPTDATRLEPGAQSEQLHKLVNELAAPAHALQPPLGDSPLAGQWKSFEDRFASTATRDGLDAQAQAAAKAAQPFEADSPLFALRQQVRRVNERLTGRYRGTFLTSYRFAALATTLAAASLGLMVLGYKFVVPTQPWPLPLKLLLLLMAFGKLMLVWRILMVTELARHRQWNERAVASRYLSENLRLMLWLPRLGRLRAPARTGQHHIGLRLGHSAIDNLLRAEVRAAPLHTGLELQPTTTTGAPLRGTLQVRKGLALLRDGWLVGQWQYHQANASKMGKMAESLQQRAERLNKVVIGCVVVDIALLAAGMLLKLAPELEVLKVALVVGAAALPAWVAATNGVREQSEASRLAERSKQLAAKLAALKADVDTAISRMVPARPAPAAAYTGAWPLEALLLADRCAALVAEDAAEWSVLYAKDVPEP